MKSILRLLILGCFFFGCKNKELPSEHLSKISVVRISETSPGSVSNHSAPETTNPVLPVTPPKSHTRYHIIVSSFGSAEKARAEKLVSQLKEKNYPATLLYSSQRYRVSIESFSTETEANKARDEYRATTDRQDIWVHKVE